MRGRTTMLSLATLAACSDAGLEAVQKEGPPPVDNKLALTGSICTQNPSDQFFPVKILLVIDTSYSMRVTDVAQQRVTAVSQLIDRYRGNPSVEFAVIAFDAVVTNITRGFTKNPDLGEISARLDESDRLTDYQGALGAAYALLTDDMVNSSPAERARSKYVVIFFSDGVPDPQCFADRPPPFQTVCNVDRDEWPDAFQLPAGTNPNTGAGWTWEDFQGLYPDLDAGKDYNSPEQLARVAEDILVLQEIYNVNEIRLHTAFLFDPNVGQAYIDAFNLDRPAAIQLMTRLAEGGNGTFTEFTSGAEINFLNVNYTSVKQSYAMTNMIAFNASALPTATGKEPDSDGDGLSDRREEELRLCAYPEGGVTCNLGNGRFRDPYDTDGDGYTDRFEDVYRSSGFDPKVPNDFAGDCDATEDSDGDGLRDCEELFLRTDPRLFDSDRDRFPDGLEVRAGLDPIKAEDAVTDNDADGVLNGEEMLRGWDPLLREPSHALPADAKYKVELKETLPDGRNCYEFEVTNLQLETTRALDPSRRGMNRVWLTFLEGPPEDPRDYGFARTACVEARFVAPDLKQPASGRLVLEEADFFSPSDPAIECVGADGKRPSERTER